MELVIIGLLIILIGGLIVGLVDINTKLTNTNKTVDEYKNKLNDLYDEKYKLQMKNDNLREDLFKLSEARNLLELQANLATDEKNKLATICASLQEEMFQLKESISVNAVKNDSVEDLETQLENLRRIIDDKVVELENLNSSAAEITELMNTKVRGLEELEAGMKALEGRIESGRKVLENLEDEIVSTNSQLTMLANLKASVLAVEEGAGSV